MRTLLAVLVSGAALAAQSTTEIRGHVVLEGGGTAPALRVVPLELPTRADGTVVRPDFAGVYAALRVGRQAENDGSFSIRVEPGAYALLAFADVDGNYTWSATAPVEPLGWWCETPGDRPGVLEVSDTPREDLVVTVRAPTPFPQEPRGTDGGELLRVHGYPVLRLKGDARERGRAHGLLVAPQIVDFFRCYVLESKLDVAAYREFAEFLDSHFDWPDAFLTEIDAVLEGMRSSGANLRVPELERDFDRVDLLAINAYIETRAMRSSCTQFAAWGERTKGTDVDGGTIAGRNMDGELDLRRVTVSHFLLFAVDPSEKGTKRYVSMMWPGFVGTITGFNEDGFHCMENAGGTGPGPVVDGLRPISWTMRQALATLGSDPTPKEFASILAANANSAGGACGPGCVILCAVPNRGQPAPAWFVEGDRFGHATRLPGEVPPRLSDAILGSNHHLAYGADPDRPGTSFGQRPGFSSRWRYEAGMQKLDAWSHVDRRIGTAEMRELLQTVAHGTTEHSIVTRPNAREFDVAVASLRPEPWDAPYREWTTFAFEELFEGGARDR